MTDAEAQAVLSDTWVEFNRVLMLIDEAECMVLLKFELKHAKRGYMAFRIHNRYNRLRAERERSEIVAITGTIVSALYGISRTTKSQQPKPSKRRRPVDA